MNEFVVINNLDSKPILKYNMDALPLHVTLSNTFYSDIGESLLLDRLKEIANNTKSFTLKAVSRQLFGKDNDIYVTEFEKTDEIQGLHLNIITSLEGLISLKTPEFAGTNYRPHTSDQPIGMLEIGSEVVINNLTLVRIVGKDVSVVAAYELLK